MNVKKYVIYVIYYEFVLIFGSFCFDYFIEFVVVMFIFSLIVDDDGVSDSGEGIFKIFC